MQLLEVLDPETGEAQGIRDLLKMTDFGPEPQQGVRGPQGLMQPIDDEMEKIVDVDLDEEVAHTHPVDEL